MSGSARELKTTSSLPRTIPSIVLSHCLTSFAVAAYTATPPGCGAGTTGDCATSAADATTTRQSSSTRGRAADIGIVCPQCGYALQARAGGAIVSGTAG